MTARCASLHALKIMENCLCKFGLHIVHSVFIEAGSPTNIGVAMATDRCIARLIINGQTSFLQQPVGDIAGCA